MIDPELYRVLITALAQEVVRALVKKGIGGLGHKKKKRKGKKKA